MSFDTIRRSFGRSGEQPEPPGEFNTGKFYTGRRAMVTAAVPFVVMVVLFAVVAVVFIVTDNSATTTEPPYPHTHLDDPFLPWLWAYAFPLAWSAMLVFYAVNTVRNREFSMSALLFIAGTSMFWIEWPADWGAYLVYNREFWNFTGWTSTWYQTYWKPVNVVFGYGIFFAVECLLLLKVVPRLADQLHRLLPRVHSTVLLIVSCLVVFYTVDIIGERLMTAAGWYSYVDPVGPAWESSRGTISFVWPVLPFLLFAVAISLALRADADGHYPNEKLFSTHRLRPGWTREFARLAVWVVTMNVALFVAQPLVTCIGRILFFHDSVYVP